MNREKCLKLLAENRLLRTPETKAKETRQRDIPIELVSLQEKDEKCILPRGRGKESHFPRASKTLTGFIHAHIRPVKRGLKGSAVG
jgi:hypothetical protein